ncbi:MAG: acetyl-CoA carboxylase biotin carboxylase subunit [Ktedonobacterales bacterium]|nr:acetyl-CoA carboxylase biotin carboxylase subunit [Ktedonobacterales bacterium]
MPNPLAAEGARFPFDAVLIANRGEIAVRIIRACRDLGLRSVAVYSDADRNAIHVRLADSAIHIGPAPANASYLNIPRIIDAAKQSGAGAIHPGYGFLSENADFAQACADAGIIFVGPPASVQRALGEKTSARRIAIEAGVPIAPGVNKDVTDAAEARALADGIGYPVLLKAAAGGGGKGIRFVYHPDEIASALAQARAEAKASFGDESVYLEKAIAPARHIEVQIMADAHGNVIHLGERECSLQRRNQKLVEESPSVALDPALRARITGAAVALAQRCGYVNAGTVEFLLGPDKQFYFMEVNTRLQVEHPVTEWCTGLDLVREQLRVAAGLPLSVRQEEVVFRGHAIECRITAEDPYNRFLPATGSVTQLREASGPGVRVDSALYPGMPLSLFYDSLLAKLIVWGPDRATAIARTQRALREYVIAGTRTTIPFAQYALAHPRFIAGDLALSFIADTWEADLRDGHIPTPDDGSDALTPAAVTAIAAALGATGNGASQTNGTAPDANIPQGSRWRDAGRGWR